MDNQNIHDDAQNVHAIAVNLDNSQQNNKPNTPKSGSEKAQNDG